MASPSPVPPNLRVVELSAWVNRREKCPLRLGADPHARVADLDAQRDTDVARGGGPEADANAARLGKLNRVGEQVEHDLPQARRIAEQGFRHARLGLDGEREPFCAAAIETIPMASRTSASGFSAVNAGVSPGLPGPTGQAGAAIRPGSPVRGAQKPAGGIALRHIPFVRNVRVWPLLGIEIV